MQRRAPALHADAREDGAVRVARPVPAAPSAVEGGLFKRSDWRFWRYGDAAANTVGQPILLGEEDTHRDLAGAYRFITCDLAASTRTSATTPSPPRGRSFPAVRCSSSTGYGTAWRTGHWDLIAPLRSRWLGPYDVTYVETAMFGTTFVYAAGQAGVPLQPLKADVDKLTRALAAAPLVAQHRVPPAGAPWLDEWLEEHAEFPTGRTTTRWTSPRTPPASPLAHWTPPADPDPRAVPRVAVRGRRVRRQ